MASLLSYALTSVSDVKESLGIPSATTTYDNLITRKINQATLAIENYCSRRFLETSYTNEEYNATNIDEMVLKQRPITATTTFSMQARDTSLNEADWDTVDTELYFVDNPSGVVYLTFNSVGRWKRYRFTYSAGYATIPEDLAEACAALAGFYYSNGSGSDVGVSRKKEGQREVQYTTATQNFKGIIEALGIDGILNSYANNPLMTDR